MNKCEEGYAVLIVKCVGKNKTVAEFARLGWPLDHWFPLRWQFSTDTHCYAKTAIEELVFWWPRGERVGEKVRQVREMQDISIRMGDMEMKYILTLPCSFKIPKMLFPNRPPLFVPPPQHSRYGATILACSHYAELVLLLNICLQIKYFDRWIEW